MTSKTKSPKQLWIVIYLYTSGSVCIHWKIQTNPRGKYWLMAYGGNMRKGEDKKGKMIKQKEEGRGK
jgi:hypothetical protein